MEADASEDYYELLGLARNAKSEEIARAVKALWKQNGEQDPQLTELLEEAKAVLLDPDQRWKYDGFIEHGQHFRDLVLAAEQANKEERFDDELALYKQLLDQYPSQHRVRLLLSCRDSSILGFPTAREAIEDLLSRDDSLPLAWCKYAELLEEEEDEGEEDRPELLEKAAAAYRRAAALHPEDLESIVSLSQYWSRNDENRHAEESLERMLRHKPPVTEAVIDALVHLTYIHLGDGGVGPLTYDVSRICKAVANESQHLKSYAADQLLHMAEALEQEELILHTPALIRASESLRPIPEDWDWGCADLEEFAHLHDQYKDLQADERIAEVYKTLADAAIRESYGVLEYEERDRLVERVRAEVVSSPKDRNRNLRLIETDYPEVYEELSPFMSLQFNTQDTPSSGGFQGVSCGCILVLMAIIGYCAYIVFNTR